MGQHARNYQSLGSASVGSPSEDGLHRQVSFPPQSQSRSLQSQHPFYLCAHEGALPSRYSIVLVSYNALYGQSEACQKIRWLFATFRKMVNGSVTPIPLTRKYSKFYQSSKCLEETNPLLFSDIQKQVYALRDLRDKIPQEVEITIVDGVPWVLQTRDMVFSDKLHQFEPPQYSPLGLPVSLGQATGLVCTDLEPQEEIKDIILLADALLPDNTPAILESKAVATRKGGFTSHVAVIARQEEIPACAGCEDRLKILPGKGIYCNDAFFAEGQKISFTVSLSGGVEITLCE